MQQLASRQLLGGAVHIRRPAPSVSQSLSKPLVAPHLAACHGGIASLASGSSSSNLLHEQEQYHRGAVLAQAFPHAATAAVAVGTQPVGTKSFCGCGCGVQALGWNTNFFGHFTLGAEVGRGSFGVVHVAVDQTGREYAVKVLSKRPGGSPSSSCTCTGNGVMPTLDAAVAEDRPADVKPILEHLEGIEREVSAWASVQGSQFVARIEGLYEDAENAYLVQELCTGGTIKALMEEHNGPLSEVEAAFIMRGVLDMLVEAHQQGICYGDVKPANFLVTSDSEGCGGSVSVRAVDFGCSRQVPLTQLCGSPLYMAPEMGNRRFGTAIDMWAAGVMLHQMLTSKLPFWQNKSAEEIAALPPWAIVGAVRTYDISYPRSTWGGISREAQQLVASMLDRNPAERITADKALAHPWFARVLGFTPKPSGAVDAPSSAGTCGADAVQGNIVQFSRRAVAAQL